MNTIAQLISNIHKCSERSSSCKVKNPSIKGFINSSKSPSKPNPDKVIYRVGVYEVEVILKQSPYLLIIDCYIKKLRLRYSGIYIPQVGKNQLKSNQSIADAIINKKAQISILTTECKITVNNTTIKLQLHTDNSNKENRPPSVVLSKSSSQKKIKPIPISTNVEINKLPPKSIPPEIFEIKKDIKECKVNFEELRENFKEIKDLMHKTLDQQSSIKTEQLKEKYNFDEISLPTLKEYATNKADKEIPSLSIFPEKLRTSSTKSGSVISNSSIPKMQETMDYQNKEIISIKDAIKALNEGQLSTQQKLAGQITQFKKEVHTSIELIIEVLKKVPKTKQEITSLIRHLKKADSVKSIAGSLVSTVTSANKGDECLTERSSRDLNRRIERSRNDGCMKKPRCNTVKGSVMRKI